MSGVNNETVWKLLRAIKVEYVFEYCGKRNIHEGRDIKYQMRSLENELQIQGSEMIMKNATEENLKTAGEMFIYLISCDHTNKAWFFFIEEMCDNYTLSQIILTLNRFIKNAENKTDEKEFNNEVQKVFRDLLKMFQEMFVLEFKTPSNNALKRESGSLN